MRAEAAEVAMNPHAFVYTDEHFDQWAFGNGRTGRCRVPRLRSTFALLLAMQIDEIDRACTLTADQKAKLGLAGRGDSSGSSTPTMRRRRRFQATGGDQNRINEIFQDIQPLQLMVAAGPFGDGSIFSKTIARTLEPVQAGRFEKVAAEKRAYQYRARVELAVNLLDNYVGMTSDQRRRLTAVIVEETRPPRRFGRQDYQAVLLQASQIPEARLRPIFDEAQWKKVRRQMDQTRGLEQYLRTNGFLPDPKK